VCRVQVLLLVQLGRAAAIACKVRSLRVCIAN
jgi:hypothetical protein